MANSFGIPSFAPEWWTKEVERARNVVREGHQVLIGSVVTSKVESETAWIRDFVEVATPYARKFLGLDAEGASQTFQDVLNQALDTGRTLLTLPRALENVIAKIETGQVEVKLAGDQSQHRIRFRGFGRRNSSTASEGSGLSWSLMFIAALAGGIYLTTAHLMIPAWFCLGLAAVTMLGLLMRR